MSVSEKPQSQHLLDLIQAQEKTTPTNAAIIQAANQLLAPYYADINTKAIVKTHGPWIEDANGNLFMDLNAAYAAVRFGHCPKPVVQAVKKQLDQAALPSRAYYNPELVKLAKVLSVIYEPLLAKTCPASNTDAGVPQLGVKLGGGDANDAAIRLALKRGMQTKKLKDTEQAILFWGGEDLFAGRMLSVLPPYVEGQSHPMSHGFYQAAKQDGPLLVGGTPTKILVPFNDLNALQYAFDQYGAQICAAFGEIILGEGGVRAATPEFLKAIQSYCEQNDALMMVDEVQTFASTGSYSALLHPLYKDYEIKPHVFIAAKALTSGVAPLSIIMARQGVYQYMGPGTDGSTFAGNPVACAAALATIKMIESENLFSRLYDIGVEIFACLKACQAKNADLKEVRGLGVMLAAEFITKEKACFYKKRLENIGADLGLTFQDQPIQGICLKLTRGNIMRITPSVMSQQEVTLLKQMLEQGLLV